MTSSVVSSLNDLFWEMADRLQTIVYLDRIPTDSNPADDPSRNRMEEAERLGWVIVDPKMPEQVG